MATLETTIHLAFWLLVLFAALVGVLALLAPRFNIRFDSLLLDFELADIKAYEMETHVAALAHEQEARKLRYLDAASRVFVPTWTLPSPLETLRTATLANLLAYRFVGPVRARRLIDEGDALTHEALCRIMGRSKVPGLYSTIRENLREEIEKMNHRREEVSELAKLHEAICEWGGHLEREQNIPWDEVVEGHRDAWETPLDVAIV